VQERFACLGNFVHTARRILDGHEKQFSARSCSCRQGSILKKRERNGYKNGYSDKKEGLPFRAGLPEVFDSLDWCGGGDLNPYALRR
jgi:hypothetical protein